MRAAAVQLNSTENKDRNLETAGRLIAAAAAAGAELVVLPEKFNVLGTDDDLLNGAESLDGPTLRWAGDLAREHDIWLVAGSIAERAEGEVKIFNTSCLLDPAGEIAATYRKIHMFDVDVAGTTYRESAVQQHGDQVVSVDLPAADLRLGMAICYDLRFPELFRIMAIEGARVISLPAAFTERTGRDHWEVLLRARAIENQVFMVGADQIGVHPPDKPSYGRSTIVDPWGVVLAVAPDDETFITAELSFAAQDSIRSRLPSLTSRVPEAYRWPQEAKL